MRYNAPRTQSLRDRVLFGGSRGTATAPVGRRGYGVKNGKSNRSNQGNS